ncbi:MAG TPA: triose-phosphate isomerase [Candidatus Nanopelagicaceae bacterium]|nr:triose-phosphate isomerase [Candidatus Nanopelagicaceae bacterium]
MANSEARRPLVAGNWKMHEVVADAEALTRGLLAGLPATPAAEVVLLPPFTALETVHRVIGSDPRLRLGAQNCHWETAGAFTGEISTAMLAPWCQYILVGHSERRQLFGETDEIVRRKLEAVLAAGMHPILALGETGDERKRGQTQTVLRRQARAGLIGLSADQVARCTLAYEPIWAIGTGAAATPADASEAAAVLRSVVDEAAAGVATTVRILYGGSVTAASAVSLLTADGVDGALVGGASLKAAEFCAIVAGAGA